MDTWFQYNNKKKGKEKGGYVMRNNVKRLLCLLLVVALSGSLFTGCSKRVNRVSVEGLIDMNTTDKFTLQYTYWQDNMIVEELAKAFMAKYPNITVKPTEFEVTANNNEIIALSGAKNLPDVFWLLNTCDFAIEGGMLYDMTPLWEGDPDTKNLIPGIEKYKIGYFGTDNKWITPVKFFPTSAWVNKQVFEDNNKPMPSKDWTWAEFEDTVEKMTFKDKNQKYIFGISEAITVITWYPIASDQDCIGEFGWDGTSFDMTNWAYGLNLESKWVNGGQKASNDLTELEAYGLTTYAQDCGQAAMRTDAWWCWEDFWMTSSFIDNNVIFVPYAMPHVEGVTSNNYIATMDMGAMAASTQHPREAYELLKWMTWGTEGWNIKLEKYPTLYDETNERYVSKKDCPITADNGVWEKFRTWFPGADDTYGRGEYFDKMLEIAKTGNWVCYGGCQIPGFTTWLDDNYNGTIKVETEVITNKKDANDYVSDLEDLANQSNKERLEQIKTLFVTN